MAWRILPADIRSRIPVVDATAKLPVGTSGYVLMADPEKCAVAREIYWSNGRFRSGVDRTAFDTILKLATDADMFLDIGAYTGVFALAVARQRPEIECHAYEIVPDNFMLLLHNVRANDLVRQVRPHLTGVGAATGTITVPKFAGRGVLPSSFDLDMASRDGPVVPVRCIDAMYPDFGGRAVLKIDVEGFEWDVLRGAEAFIGRVKPDIVCEVLRRAKHIEEMTAFLGRHGYRMLHISDGILEARHEVVPDKDRREWLFTCRSPAELAGAGIPADR
jgi:FkbM family methyltransferase